jgi:hypothetical protein
MNSVWFAHNRAYTSLFRQIVRCDMIFVLNSMVLFTILLACSVTAGLEHRAINLYNSSLRAERSNLGLFCTTLDWLTYGRLRPVASLLVGDDSYFMRYALSPMGRLFFARIHTINRVGG